MESKKDIITIGNKSFEVVGLLGKGGFGKVFKVADTQTGRKLAIKCIYQEVKEGDRMYQAIAGEIRMMQALQHPNIIRLIGYNLHGTHDGQPCVQLVEELAPMCELLEYNIHCAKPFEEGMCLYLMKQTFEAVAYMHDAGIAHRDLKPQNILLDRKFNIKLADFGFAKAFQKKERTVSMKSHLGTPGYMAPEISLRKEYTAKVDVFALGVVLFVCLSQRCPFKKAMNDSQFWYWDKIRTNQWKVFWLAHQRRHTFSDLQKDLLQKMLAADPKKRLDIFQTLEHDWFIKNAGKMASPKEYVEKMTQRYRTVRKKIQQESAKSNRSTLDPNEKDFFSVSELLHNQYRQRFATVDTQAACAQVFAECAQLPVKSVLPKFENQDLANLRATFTECTDKAHVAPYMPADEAKKLDGFWLRLNTNKLATPGEVLNFANVKTYENLEATADIPVYSEEQPFITEFQVKIGFGTLVMILKKFHEKTAAPVRVEPEEGKVVVSFPITETFEVEGEQHTMSDTLDLSVNMFRKEAGTTHVAITGGFCFFNDQATQYVNMLVRETKLALFASVADYGMAQR